MDLHASGNPAVEDIKGPMKTDGTQIYVDATELFVWLDKLV